MGNVFEIHVNMFCLYYLFKTVFFLNDHYWLYIIFLVLTINFPIIYQIWKYSVRYTGVYWVLEQVDVIANMRDGEFKTELLISGDDYMVLSCMLSFI